MSVKYQILEESFIQSGEAGGIESEMRTFYDLCMTITPLSLRWVI